MRNIVSRDIVAVARASSVSGTTTALLAACRAGQRAYEWHSKGHGVFTYYLLEGLDGAAWNGNRLEFGELARHVAHSTRAWCGRMSGLSGVQEPWFEHFGNPAPILLAGSTTVEERRATHGRASASRQGPSLYPQADNNSTTTPAPTVRPAPGTYTTVSFAGIGPTPGAPAHARPYRNSPNCACAGTATAKGLVGVAARDGKLAA